MRKVEVMDPEDSLRSLSSEADSERGGEDG